MSKGLRIFVVLSVLVLLSGCSSFIQDPFGTNQRYQDKDGGVNYLDFTSTDDLRSDTYQVDFSSLVRADTQDEQKSIWILPFKITNISNSSIIVPRLDKLRILQGDKTYMYNVDDMETEYIGDSTLTYLPYGDIINPDIWVKGQYAFELPSSFEFDDNTYVIFDSTSIKHPDANSFFGVYPVRVKLEE